MYQLEPTPSRDLHQLSRVLGFHGRVVYSHTSLFGISDRIDRIRVLARVHDGNDFLGIPKATYTMGWCVDCMVSGLIKANRVMLASKYAIDLVLFFHGWTNEPRLSVLLLGK